MRWVPSDNDYRLTAVLVIESCRFQCGLACNGYRTVMALVVAMAYSCAVPPDACDMLHSRMYVADVTCAAQHRHAVPYRPYSSVSTSLHRQYTPPASTGPFMLGRTRHPPRLTGQQSCEEPAAWRITRQLMHLLYVRLRGPLPWSPYHHLIC